jgi:lipoprotein signal peptidase
MVIIGGLVVVDQVSKRILTTEEWAWHNQPRTWLIKVAIGTLIGVFLLLTRFRPGGILLIAGGLSNGMSEAIHDTIANPFQTQYGMHVVAFNAADVYLVFIPIACVIGVITSRIRSANPTPEAAT